MKSKPPSRLPRALTLAAASLWLGTLLMAAATAAIAFPTMKTLDPTLPAYAAYPADHWTIAAGHIMQRVFHISDIVRVACLLVVIASSAWLLLHQRHALSKLQRSAHLALVLLLLCIVAFSMLILSPAMNADLASFWTAARDGNTAAADLHREAFADRHPISTRLLTAEAAALAALIMTTIYFMIRPHHPV